MPHSRFLLGDLVNESLPEVIDYTTGAFSRSMHPE
jgi:hypothetical protein